MRISRARAERRGPSGTHADGIYTLRQRRMTRFGIGAGLSLYFLLSALFLGRSLVHPGTTHPGYLGDAEQYMWYLGWFWHAVSAGKSPFVTHLMNYPMGMNLMWNTSIFAEAAIFGPIAALANLPWAYNLWFAANFLLTGALAQRLLAALGVRQWLQIAVASLVTIMPYITTQALSHISLITIAPLLGALCIVAAVSQRPKLRPGLMGAAFGLLVGIQFYTLIEVLVSGLLAAAVAAAVAYLTARNALFHGLRRLPPAFLLWGLFVAALVIAPGAYEMLFGPFRVFSSVQPPNIYVVDFLSLLWPTHAFFAQLPGIDPASVFTGNYAEDNGYLGFAALAMAIWGTRRLWTRPLPRVLAVSALVLTLLALGRNLHIAGLITPVPLPWLLLDQIPFLKDILPARLMLYADLAVLGIVALALEDWLQEPQRRSAMPLWGLAGMALLWLPAIPYPNSRLPAATSAFAPGTAVRSALRGQPTYILTAAFPEVMEMLARTGYAFPIANVYGHNDNTPARTQELQDLLVLLDPGRSAATYRSAISRDLPQLGVTRLLFIPRQRYDSQRIPAPALKELDAALGPPIVSSPSGILVWRVSPSH